MKINKIREKLIAAVFIGIIGVICLLNILVPPPGLLFAERRVPAKFPELTADTVLSGEFSEGFENYANDNFIFRDAFRAVNSFLVFEVYWQADKSGLYRSDAVGLGRFADISDETLYEVSQKILGISEVFQGLDMNLYYSLIPDKSIYADMYLPGYDFDNAERIFFVTLPEFSYIPISNFLNAGSFYRTDLHWNQKSLTDAANQLLFNMGADAMPRDFVSVPLGNFRGVYAGQYALPVAPDEMSYYWFDNIWASYLSPETMQMEPGLIYDAGKLSGIDPYDFFLQGPQPVVTIDNPSRAGSPRELYMFRDSFGSSLAPLLANSYSRITLIDLRYIHLSMLGEYVGFTPGSDVLFIFSSQIFGNSNSLQS